MPNAQSKTFWVYLNLRNSQQLDQTIAAVSDPSSPSYGQYLTPGQFHARYAPTNADLKAVRDWLRAQGMSVSSDVPDNNRWLEATGDVSKIEKAFATQIRTYRYAGKTLPAPSGDLTVPASIASKIAGVTGLDGSDRLLKPHAAANPTPGDIPGAPPSPAFVNAPPCSSYWGQKIANDKPKAYGSFQAYAPCGYVPSQLQGAYGTTKAISKGNDGARPDGGDHRRVRGADDPAGREHLLEHGTACAPVKFRQIVPPGIFNAPEDDQCDAAGLVRRGDARRRGRPRDGARARTCSTSGGKDCDDEALIAALNKIVDGNLAQIVTNSFGDVGEDVPAGINKACERHLPPGRDRGHRRLLLVRRRRRRDREPRHPRHRLPGSTTRSSPPSAAPPRRRAGQQLPVRDGLGHVR